MGRDIVLRTARLVLRSFRATDVDDALAYRNDPAFARFLRHIPQPFTRANAEEFVRVNMTEPWETLPTFAVVLDDRVIGTVNFNIDQSKRRAMLGYAIARAHWGRGIAVEAASAALEWVVAEHDLTEIWASTDKAHMRSRRVLEKLGLTFERDDGEVFYRLQLVERAARNRNPSGRARPRDDRDVPRRVIRSGRRFVRAA